MKSQFFEELKNIKDDTDFMLNNKNIVEIKHVENYLRKLEFRRYNMFNIIKENNKQVDDLHKIYHINNRYKAFLRNEVLEIYIPEVLPKAKPVNDYAYNNILFNVMEVTKRYAGLYDKELACILIVINEKESNSDIDNKYVKPIADGLVHAKVINDDNKKNMFYTAIGTNNLEEGICTRVYVFKGILLIEWFSAALNIFIKI